MARKKPWETDGPPVSRSRKEMGRDERFKVKFVPPPEPLHYEVPDWSVIRDATWDFTEAFSRMKQNIESTSAIMSVWAELRETREARLTVLEEDLFIDHEESLRPR